MRPTISYSIVKIGDLKFYMGDLGDCGIVVRECRGTPRGYRCVADSTRSEVKGLAPVYCLVHVSSFKGKYAQKAFNIRKSMERTTAAYLACSDY
jgi:hypothetical protein